MTWSCSEVSSFDAIDATTSLEPERRRSRRRDRRSRCDRRARSPGCRRRPARPRAAGSAPSSRSTRCAWTWRSAASVPCGVHARSSGIASSTRAAPRRQVDLALPPLVLDAAPRPDLVAAVRDRGRRHARVDADRHLGERRAPRISPSHDPTTPGRDRARRGALALAVEIDRARSAPAAPSASNSSTRAPTGVLAVGDAQRERRRRGLRGGLPPRPHAPSAATAAIASHQRAPTTIIASETRRPAVTAMPSCGSAPSPRSNPPSPTERSACATIASDGPRRRARTPTAEVERDREPGDLVVARTARARGRRPPARTAGTRPCAANTRRTFAAISTLLPVGEAVVARRACSSDRGSSSRHRRRT